MSEYIVRWFFVILGICRYLNAECPAGWLHHGTSCYYFSDDAFSWDIAQDLCKEFHGYLAEVDNKEESDYLEAFTRPRKKSYWIGGKDDITEGHWYWANSMKAFTFTDWSPGEPNDSGHDEDCLHLYDPRDQHWNDFPCSNPQNYICETSFSGS